MTKFYNFEKKLSQILRCDFKLMQPTIELQLTHVTKSEKKKK